MQQTILSLHWLPYAEVRAVKLQKRLKTVAREIRAVKAGLKGLDEADAVTASAALDDNPQDKGTASAEGARQEVAVKPEATAAPEDGAASAAGSQLQRATMLQRLEALRAKKAQLQVGLIPMLGPAAPRLWQACHTHLAFPPSQVSLQAYQMQPVVPNQLDIESRMEDAPCACCDIVPLTCWPHIFPGDLASIEQAGRCQWEHISWAAHLKMLQQSTCSTALQEALEEAEAAAEGAASGGQGPQAAPAVVLLEDDPFERELAANDNSSMVETERDRLIRLVRHISSSAAQAPAL